MDAIALMMEEHKNILRFIEAVRSACRRILEGGKPDPEDFRDMLAFARTYADRHHHGKEEKVLFREMEARQGPVAAQLIHGGMLVEHDLGRLYLYELEQALDRWTAAPNVPDKLEILVNAGAWADLLTRHIDKEDGAVYPFARRGLGRDALELVDREVETFEAAPEIAVARQRALDLLERLEKKYA